MGLQSPPLLAASKQGAQSDGDKNLALPSPIPARRNKDVSEAAVWAPKLPAQLLPSVLISRKESTPQYPLTSLCTVSHSTGAALTQP